MKTHLQKLCTTLLIVSFLLAASWVAPAHAATTWHVTKLADTIDGTCDGDCSLREAIVAAGSGDTVDFPSVTGTITLGLGQLQIDKDLTITGPGETNLTVSANDQSRVFSTGGGYTVSISGMTITDGLVNTITYPVSGEHGAGIYNAGFLTLDHVVVSSSDANLGGGGIYSAGPSSSLTITNSRITGNSATGTSSFGGGIQILNGSLSMTTVIVDGNLAIASSGNAGGLYVDSAVTPVALSGVTFDDNHAQEFGAAYLGGATTIDDSVFSGNRANTGGAGGIYSAGSLDIDHTQFTDNDATNVGGAIESYGPLTVNDSTFSLNDGSAGGAISHSSGSDTVTIRTSTFTHNSATSLYAGAIYGHSGTISVANSTFEGNTSAGAGGGLYNLDATTLLVNDTFSGNAATAGGAVYQSSTGSGSIGLTNNIMANSSAPEDCFSANALSADTNNLIQTNSGTDPCGTPVLTTDPDLGSLANNGGPTQTMALLPGSAAINAGDDTACLASPVNGVDQRGVPRPQGPHCDLGAYESEITVSFRSVGTQDGWLLESSETSGKASTWDSTATQFFLGDNSANKQYRAILSFDTSALPDTAVVTAVTLKIKKTGLVGVDPFASLGNIMIDVKKGIFSGNAALQLTDFYAAGSKNYAAKFTNTPVGMWYSSAFGPTSLGYINRTGTTQFRLRFATDDNNNLTANYLKFGSGDAITSSRPTLSITYYLP